MTDKEELNAASYLKENLKDIKEIEEKKIANCEFCGTIIRSTKWKKGYHLININQKPEKRLFCSRQCKLKWVFKNF